MIGNRKEGSRSMTHSINLLMEKKMELNPRPAENEA